jgi:hypothetical protein
MFTALGEPVVQVLRVPQSRSLPLRVSLSYGNIFVVPTLTMKYRLEAGS